MTATKAPGAARGRLLLLVGGMAALVGGTLGGLARFGVLDAAALAAPVRLHAALMICGFLGTVIGLERAVALRTAWAYGAPLAAVLGTALALLGRDRAALAAWLLAALLLLAASIAIQRRQRAPHTFLLTAAVLMWLSGLALALLGAAWDAVLLAWFDFLVLTIAAERLELTRLMRRRPWATPLLATIVLLLMLGPALLLAAPPLGLALHGAALVALALWLLAFDLARRTLGMDGVAGYAAACLLSGYAWLAVAGGGWIALALGHAAARDLALHALGLGFVVAMIFGHAPIILPAVARVRLRFGRHFYAPLALLHFSLLLRLAGGDALAGARMLGAQLNALAIGVFAASVIAAVLAARSGPAAARGIDGMH